MWNINAQQGRIACEIFTKVAEFVPHFRMRQLLKFGWICSRGYGVMGVLSWGRLVTPKFSGPPSGETMCQTPKVLEEQEHARGPLSPCQVWCGSDFTRRRGGQKRWVFVCLFVCLFVTLLNVRDCAPDCAMKALEYRKDFDAVGLGKFCSCAPVFNFLRLLPIGDTTKCRNPKYGKIWQKSGFSYGDRINRSRRNLARRPRVCYSTPNLALIGKRQSIRPTIILPR